MSRGGGDHGEAGKSSAQVRGTRVAAGDLERQLLHPLHPAPTPAPGWAALVGSVFSSGQSLASGGLARRQEWEGKSLALSPLGCRPVATTGHSSCEDWCPGLWFSQSSFASQGPGWSQHAPSRPWCPTAHMFSLGPLPSSAQGPFIIQGLGPEQQVGASQTGLGSSAGEARSCSPVGAPWPAAAGRTCWWPRTPGMSKRQEGQRPPCPLDMWRPFRRGTFPWACRCSVSPGQCCF